MQRGLAAVVPCVDVGAVVEEVQDCFVVAVECCEVERGAAGGVAGVGVGTEGEGGREGWEVVCERGEVERCGSSGVGGGLGWGCLHCE